jgi:hypothetical protein
MKKQRLNTKFHLVKSGAPIAMATCEYVDLTHDDNKENFAIHLGGFDFVIPSDSVLVISEGLKKFYLDSIKS